MYLRFRKNKTGTTTVYLLDSMRVEGKKHAISKVVKCFGSSSDEAKIEQWRKEALELKSELESQNVRASDALNIQQGADVDSCVAQELGAKYLYDHIFDSVFGTLKLKGANPQTLKDLVSLRAISPFSKLRTSQIAEDFGVHDLTVNRIYKMMDALDDEQIEAIKIHVANHSKKLLGGKLKVMFYDLTTISFEANSKSDLKEFGYSKDGKSQHVQISMALMVSEQGLPVGYEIFKGNVFEGKTLIPTLDKLREKYKISDITIVADSAMLSRGNLAALIQNNYKFIVAARVRNLTREVAKKMLDNSGYKKCGDDFRYKKIPIENGQIFIAAYSDERRKKDEYDSERALEKINKFIGKSSKDALRGSLKKSYLRLNQESIIEIDQAKLTESKKTNGYFGYITNSSCEAEEVIEQYKGLWQVEQSFRINKHNLKIRPVYHFADRRIKAHFALCYMSFALLRTLEYKTKKANAYIPMETMHLLLAKVKSVKIVTKESSATITTDIPKPIKLIYNALNLKHPNRFTPS